MQDAATPVAAVFVSVEVVFLVCLSLVAYRIGRGRTLVRCRPSFALLSLSCLSSLALGIWSAVEEEYPTCILGFSQATCDVALFILLRRASSCSYARGTVSAWRSVVSAAISLCAALFVAVAVEFQVIFVLAALFRIAWLVATFFERRRFKDRAFLDEWGLLLSRWPSDLSELLINDGEDGEEGYDSENPLTEERDEGEIVESFLLGGALPPPIARNISDSTSDSTTDSFPLIRPPSLDRVNQEESPSQHRQDAAARPGDDAGGPRPGVSESLAQRLPLMVEVVAHREVLTTGGVPLVVYVVRTDRNGILVHRYGEFRGLCNRVVSRLYHEMGAETPPFPGRRVFRKFIPQAMGGMAQGAAGDREFIANRASGLGDWLQKVINFARDHPENEGSILALLDFLKPIVHYSPDSDLEQVIRSAVLIFSDTVLNPIAPPSPYI